MRDPISKRVELIMALHEHKKLLEWKKQLPHRGNPQPIHNKGPSHKPK